MKRIAAILLMAFMAGLWTAPTTASTASGLNDAADFFTAEGEQKAMAAIADISRRHHGEELFIETQNAIPAGMTYEQFADQQTKAAHVRGVYILIVRKGGQVHVAASSDTAQLFSRSVRDQLALQILIQIEAGTKAGAKHFDEVLLHAVNTVAETFEDGEKRSEQTAQPYASQPVPQRAPERSSAGDSGGSWFVWPLALAALGIGAWIVVVVFRAARRQTMDRPTHYSGGPKGDGFGRHRYDESWEPSMMGGLLGSGLASRLDDPPNQSEKSYADDSVEAPNWAGPSDTSQGYESSDATHATDFGGGGDVGGSGDSGGGGDSGG